MRIGVGGFEQFAGEEVVDGGAAGGVRMPPGRALHRSHAGKCQRGGQCVHAHVGEHKDVRLQLCDLLAGCGYVARDDHVPVGRLSEPRGHFVAVFADRNDDDFEIVSRKMFHTANVLAPIV